MPASERRSKGSGPRARSKRRPLFLSSAMPSSNYSSRTRLKHHHLICTLTLAAAAAAASTSASSSTEMKGSLQHQQKQQLRFEGSTAAAVSDGVFHPPPLSPDCVSRSKSAGSSGGGSGCISTAAASATKSTSDSDYRSATTTAENLDVTNTATIVAPSTAIAVGTALGTITGSVAPPLTVSAAAGLPPAPADNGLYAARSSSSGTNHAESQQVKGHVYDADLHAAAAAAAAATPGKAGRKRRQPLWRAFGGSGRSSSSRERRQCPKTTSPHPDPALRSTTGHHHHHRDDISGSSTGATAAPSTPAALESSPSPGAPAASKKWGTQPPLSPPFSPPTTSLGQQGADPESSRPPPAVGHVSTPHLQQGQAHNEMVMGGGSGEGSSGDLRAGLLPKVAREGRAGAVGHCGANLGGTTQEDVATRPAEPPPQPVTSAQHAELEQQGLVFEAAAAAAAESVQDPQSMVVLHGAGAGVGGAPPGGSVSGALRKFGALLLPEMMRAAKFAMTGGVIFGAFRGLTSIVKRFRRPRKAERWPGQVSKDGGGRGGAGAAPGDRARRARESLLMQAGGMHVPVDVVAGLDEFELEIAADLVDCDRLDVTFEDIAGMDSVKNDLQEIISEPLDFPPDLYPARLIKPCNGILIYGPPGCGKTLLAKAVAKQSGAAFIGVKASTLMRRPRSSGGSGGGGGGRGEGGANRGGGGRGAGHSSVMVRALFSLAQKIQPCIIFFDEADGLCFKREEGDCGPDREMMTELMQLWDGLTCSGQDRVVVLAATNRPWDLDPAVQRRFSRSFQVGLPDRKMRKAVLMKALEDVEVEEGFDWRELAVNTEGYSCGDVVELCREAVRGPLREAVERNRRRASRRQQHGYRHSPRLSLQQQQQQQQRQRNRSSQFRGDWQADMNAPGSFTGVASPDDDNSVATAAPMPLVRMRPLRMSDINAAQRRVVPAFWQSEAYRATYEGYMGSLMEHARQNWSR